jgi:hypothetical protein
LNKEICDNLTLRKETATHCENLIKRLFTEKKYLITFYERHLDQIVICCIIAILKLFNLYQENNYYNTIIKR